jgi:hypothetical protein
MPLALQRPSSRYCPLGARSSADRTGPGSYASNIRLIARNVYDEGDDTPEGGPSGRVRLLSPRRATTVSRRCRALSAGGRGPAPTLIAMTRNRPGPGGRSRIKAVAERLANPSVSRCELAATLALRKAPSSAPVAAGSTAIQAFPAKNRCWRLTAGPCFPLRFFGAGAFSTAATTRLLSGLAVLRRDLSGRRGHQ